MTSSLSSNVPTPELTPSQSTRSSPSLSPLPECRPLDIVIAHYNEPLDWLSTCSSLATVYSKGQPPSSTSHYRKAKNLPNWGRESHTYLHHIVQNYDTLPDVTLFLQGNIHDINDETPAHTELTLEEIVAMTRQLSDPPSSAYAPARQTQNHPQGDILPLGKINTFSDWDGVTYLPGWVARRGKTLARSKFTPEQFWNYLINGTADKADPRWTNPPREINWTQGALFAVTRQTIQSRPREVYERAYEYFHVMEEVNPEEGHYMERFWLSIFGVGEARSSQVQDAHAIKSDMLAEQAHGLDGSQEGVFVLEDAQ